jgi:2-methylaconitate cis-trans-isomerase PrpF
MRTNTVLGSVSDLDLDPNGSGLKLTPGSAIVKKSLYQDPDLR